MTTLIKNARLFTRKGLVPGDVCLTPQGLAAPAAADATIDVAGAILAPGLVDVHIHGSFDVDCLDGGDSVATMAAGLPRFGVTGFLPSLAAAPLPTMTAAMVAACEYMSASNPMAAKVYGVHLEGPFFNPARAGAQPHEALRLPNLADYQAIVGEHEKHVKKISLSCELPGGIDFARELAARGVAVSLAHTEATAEQAHEIFGAGVRHFTHCFNAAGPMFNRAPGPAIAALNDARITLEMICDNVHLHRDLMKVMLCCAADRIIGITDAMMAAGTGREGEFMLAGQKVYVKDGAARLDSESLAGSVATLDFVTQNLMKLGLSQYDALACTASRPRTTHGLPGGFVEPGAPADVVLFDDDLRVLATYIDGREVYKS